MMEKYAIPGTALFLSSLLRGLIGQRRRQHHSGVQGLYVPPESKTWGERMACAKLATTDAKW